MPDGQPDNDLVFELIRIGGGRHDGTLLCLRYSPEAPETLRREWSLNSLSWPPAWGKRAMQT